MSLRRFHNKHIGETCYLFGDGPSIKSFDLSNFDEYIGICCGNLMFHDDFSKLDVRYYTIPEPYLFVPYWIHRREYLKGFQVLFKEFDKYLDMNRDIDFFINVTNILSKSGSNIHYIHRYLHKNHPKFYHFKGIDPFRGSFDACLSLAHFMGFSKAYLVGFDAFTIQRKSSNRWYEFGRGEPEDMEIQKTDDDYVGMLKKHMDLYSIVLDGKPYNMKSIKYEEYTGKPAEYKENYELTSSKNLKILSTYPGYSIFKDRYH